LNWKAFELSVYFRTDLPATLLSVKRPSHCQYTGERGEDCEYTIAFAGLRSIKATCTEQIAALTQTIEAIDSLLPKDAPASPKKAKAKAA
jgi:hypothetical protein